MSFKANWLPTRTGMVFEKDPKTGRTVCTDYGREVPDPKDARIRELEAALAAEAEARREAEGEAARLRDTAVRVLGATDDQERLDVALEELERVVRRTPVYPVAPDPASRTER